jgi:hypothetical protein
MSPRGLHADGEKPDGYYRGVRQLPPYVGCGAGVATARYPRESPGRFRRHLAFLARPSRSRCIDSLHGQLRVQLTSRCANKTVISGTRRTTMPPMPHSGAAQNKGYGRSDFAGQSWDCAAILPAPNSLYCGCERSFGPGADLPAPCCHAAPLPSRDLSRPLLSKTVYPGSANAEDLTGASRTS